ncbi:hypothetical protein [Paucidesulfovibrio longus]|uniref:hypothetical protein n=1 Tax=Paucidesulfovibrio longus TaxID=889 RepID=UPI0012DE16C3|nr:hypothetical protein [Paucidesulfovibrio longus]
MSNNTWVAAPVWKDWRILMRTLYCSRIAFDAEISKWKAPSVEYDGKTLIRFSDGLSNYETELDEHIATLSDGAFFYSMILLRAVSLLESHSKLVLYIINNGKWDLFERNISEHEHEEIDQLRLENGIAVWGTQLLASVGQSWDKVYKNQAGLEEVVHIRNAIAHGYNTFTPNLYKKITNVAPSFPFNENDHIQITHDLLREYTGRIKSLLRILCDGVYHTNKSL